MDCRNGQKLKTRAAKKSSGKPGESPSRKHGAPWRTPIACGIERKASIKRPGWRCPSAFHQQPQELSIRLLNFPAGICWRQYPFDGEVYTRDDQGHDQVTRMPALRLWGEAGNWNISVWEWVPGPGPSDFTKKLISLDEALAKIMSYFFDPNDHNVKEAQLALRAMAR